MWPAFSAVGGAWLFVLIGPLVLLYFLKLRRPRQVVPSLVLWRQVINDNRVNSPLQRFKRNLLLLLQLLLLIAIILAAMRPYMRGDVTDAGRLPILIDHSASMAALDAPGGTSRLEQVRKQIHDIIDGLDDRTQVALIAFSRNARALTGFTNNKRTLRNALDALTVEDVSSDVEDALRMTAALAQTEPFNRALLLTDGNFPAESNVALPFRVEYQKVAPAGANFGITAFNARRAGRGQWDVFTVIEGSPATGAAPATVTATVELLQDGTPLPIDDPQVIIAQGQSQRLQFRITAAAATSLELRMTIDGFDALASDNRAYLDLEPARPLAVYVPMTMATARNAMLSITDVRIFPQNEDENVTATDFDLLISNDPADLERTARARLFVDVVPDDIADLVASRDEMDSVIDWERNAELLRYVTLDKLAILTQSMWQPDADEADLEARGYEVIMHGEQGPLMLRKRMGSDVTYYQLFDTDRTTLPFEPVPYLILMQNLANIAMHNAGLAETHAQRTGVLAPRRVEPATTYAVRGPDGASRHVQSDQRAMLMGVAAPRVGRYTIEGGDATAQIGASLLSPTETSLRGHAEVTFDEQTVTATAGAVQTDHAYWRQLLIAAFVVLMLEWWYFQRKPGGHG